MTDRTAALEPCPFDDGQGLHGGIVVRDNGEIERWAADVYWMRCKCGAEGPNARSPAKAKIFWNRRSTAKEADVWRDLVERAHHLAVCVFKGVTKADTERNRHNAAVLANAIDRARQSERNRAALLPSEGAEPIPSGVYYLADPDNFYSVKTVRGMGTAFYRKWRARKAEFPSEGTKT